MMISKYYYDVLEVEQDASEKEIENAYQKITDKYLTDKISEKEKEINNIKNVQIKLAYKRLTEEYNSFDIIENLTLSSAQPQHEDEVVDLLYKYGFDNFKKAMEEIIDVEDTENISIGQLKKYTNSLKLLYNAERCFFLIIKEHPGTRWVHDSKNKIKRIEYFYKIYSSILSNKLKRNS